MCQFFSCISNGKGKTLFFKPEDIANQMAIGNPKSYEWNSHTSIAHFFKISPEDESKWNKWEYNVETKVLTADQLVTTNDSPDVEKSIQDFLHTKDLVFLRNLYNCNSGDCNSGNWNSGNRNSGDCNSGNWNSGNRNSGNWNSGNRNSGDCNSGNWNSGNRNSGNWNSGNCNSGDWNSGNRNSGNWNSGNRNSGDCNSGDCNSGNWNSGDCNSGNWNSGDCNLCDGFRNYFSTEQRFFLFNKPCKETDVSQISNLSLENYLNVLCWIPIDQMTDQEKKDHPESKITGGYLKQKEYKEAWKDVPKEVIDKIKKLKNFNKKIFFEISGIKVK